MLQYTLAILSLITVIGIGVAYDFDFSFAFHTPGSGYTIIQNQMYANNGTDTSSLSPLFVQPANGTINFANTTVPQPMSGAATDANTTEPQPMSETQNQTTSSPSDIIFHLNLARQALELGDPKTILKELDFIEQQLYFVTQNATSDFSTMSNSSSTELEVNATKNQPEDIEEDIPVEEQLPRSSASRDDTPQRTRSYQ